MKKTLVALAAFAAASSFAQSSVTLSGIVDFSFSNISGSGTNATTKRNNINQSTTASTSAINITVVEDLGGGLKAEGAYQLDPRAFSNNNTTAMTRHQTYLGLSGGFGSLKLGAANAPSLQAYLASSPLGTGIGSAYGNTDHTAVTSLGTVRYNNSLRYDTPNMGGFSAALVYAPGNKDATSGGATPAVVNLGLTYSNGPLHVSFSNLQTSATDAQALVAATPSALQVNAVAATVKSSFNYLGANYNFGAVKLFAGLGRGNDSAAGADVKSTRVGASFNLGAVTLIGQYASTGIGAAANRKALGLRADYALSKRTVAYTGYESYNSGAAAANKTNTLAVGVRHAF